MPTIQDVARRARVSTATVSRVLSTPEVVSETTRERVMSAVESLGYEPNHAAKSLRTLRTAKIVVTVPDISNPFFSSVIRGAEEAAQAAGYSVLLGDTRDSAAREDQYAGMLRRKEADGLIFLGHRLPATLADLIARQGAKAPVVNGCEFSPGLGVSSAHIDNTAAAAEAMDLLYGLGHRAIGVITGPLISPISRDRLAGVRAAAARHGAEARLRVATGDFSVESGEREAKALLSDPNGPSALFCFSDEMAMGALAAIRQAGRRCPDDISLVGFDDIRFARYLDPALTTVSQPMEEIGRTAVGLLLEILRGAQAGPRSVTLPHRLVVRGSTGPARR
ncbi:LacI family DNA-binding transcriptional regulator [Nitrospirillum iridis]|uniref:LacI family repressor for deo operon, udp, cdd, tsx, nupC, and nupG n=1 Tax=Nitrospirillum iridis TaxID=765888 RepID=A0A7X0AZ71_9PROT|nr:LacI family DNA-binding transcriptional regulator [Nitrospirillum iridis]MBB6252056.1 LacI family repressor for deo operon, udp, cdd, tsx, nupC, and nupG [Nitrospirillum iridis]